jgi:hypothetical protein
MRYSGEFVISRNDRKVILLNAVFVIQSSLKIRRGLSVRAAALRKILRRTKLSIRIDVFIRRYVHSLQAYECNPCKLQYSQGTLSATESGRAVPYPDVARWVRAYGLIWGVGRQAATGRFGAGCSRCSANRV